MKKRINAFTLIELLAVIVILAIIALIATPIILGIVEDTKRDAYLRDCEMIEHAAELYIANELQGNVNEKELIIPLSELSNYVKVTEDKLDENIVIKNIDGKLSYYYTGRDNNPYSNLKTLKEVIESDTDHIVKNTKVNGAVVNKVIGNKDNKYEQKNHVWYSGQLWQVLETNDNNHSIKLVTADPLTSISYGETSDWNTSWARQWLNEEFLSIIERKDIVVDTTFCLDEPNITESIQEESGSDWIKKVTGATSINTCINSVIEKVGLLTVEDYAYALNGTTLNYQGNNFLDADDYTWTMSPYTGATKEGATTNKHVWLTWYNNPSYLTVLTGLNNEGVSAGYYGNSTTNGDDGIGIRAVISIKDDILIKNGDGTKKNPYVLITEKKLEKGTTLNNIKVGEYVYLDESNNPNTLVNETVLTGVTYNTSKDKVRYRIVKINEDGTVKLERAAILKHLPNEIAVYSSFVPYYYKIGDTASTSCFYDGEGIYFDKIKGKYYTNGCSNHNYFKLEEGNGDYKYTDGENVGYFLNNATNSFYNWYSDSTKEMLKEVEWKLPVGANGKDYKTTLYNEDDVGTYPHTTTDGVTTAYIGLPQYGEIYSGNDLEFSYWYINRAMSAITTSYVHNRGYTTATFACIDWLALRPVIVLKSNVKIQSGEGTITNPYSLSL